MSPTETSGRPTLAATWMESARRWTVPGMLLIVIGFAGVLSNRAIHQSTQKNLTSKLTTILETDIKALTIWTDEQKRSVLYLAQRPELRQAAGVLVAGKDSVDTAPTSHAEALAALEKIYQEASQTFGYVDYRVADREGRILVDSNATTIQAGVDDRLQAYLARLTKGESVFIKPSRQTWREPTGSDSVLAHPLLWVAAPVLDRNGDMFAAIAFGISPEGEFTEILSVARAGESGETFAFDDEGWLLSDSRFDEELQRIGVLKSRQPADSRLSAVLNVRSQVSNGELTKLVEAAIRAKRNSQFEVVADLSGAKDYRGVRVVGASQWLPQYDFGVVTKLDYDEAYAPGLLLRNIVASLLSLSLVAFASNVLFTRRLTRLHKRALRAEFRARQLGQYTLMEKIGEGGMGEVYRAKHALLRRPTAVKLLRPDRSSEAAIARFEQEVQMTAMLTHPNTIAIYDYGRTPDGTFYYAMEYLDGLDLGRVMKLDGPQPAGRVIAILYQVCQSLTEAHEAGLIHRDIKPGNVILLCRGSRADIVKVLDFGLVRDVTSTAAYSNDRSLAGTPAYMSPESFRTPDAVDARSDIYAVGAIGYFLLTGTDAVKADKATILSQMLAEAPAISSPSHRLGRAVDTELSNVLMSCLQANRQQRPQTASELSALLTSCKAASQWSSQQSIQWWQSLEQSRSDLIDGADVAMASRNEETLDY